MALADYRKCDLCGDKAFYDAALRYDFQKYPERGLYLLGDWAVLCLACAKTHRCIVVEREGVDE